MRVLDAIKIARWRFNRDSYRGYYGNRWRPDRRGWRKVILNTKTVCEKRGMTLNDFRGRVVCDRCGADWVSTDGKCVICRRGEMSQAFRQ